MVSNSAIRRSCFQRTRNKKVDGALILNSMKEDYKYEQNAFETCTICNGLSDLPEHNGFMNPWEIIDKGKKCPTCDGEGKTLRYNFFKPNDELAEHLMSSGFKKDKSHSYKRIFNKGKFNVVY